METPVLTQSQKSKALSGNKSKKKKKSTNIRNVLGNFGTRSSFKLTDEDSILFEEKMSEIFHFSPRKKPKWNKIKDIQKEKRTEFRKTLIEPKNPLLSHLIFGINEVTRAIENKICTIILLSNDITPIIMTRHIYEACKIYKIPLLEIPNLRSITKKCFGFPAISVAFKSIPKDNPLLSIRKFLITVIPQIRSMDKILSSELTAKPINGKTSEIQKNSEKMKIVKNKCINEDLPTRKTNVYLYRDVKSSTGCFIPQKSISIQNDAVETKIIMDYIPFGNDDDDDEIKNDDVTVKKRKKKIHNNLIVKRVKPNPKRQKGMKKNK